MFNLTTDTSTSTVSSHLAEIEKTIDAEVRANHKLIDGATNHLLAAGGKRTRPLLVLTAFEFGASPEPEIYTIAAAVEIIHAASLIHDDIIDGADRRRGLEALHRKYGNEISILTGDYLFAKAFALINRFGNSDILDAIVYAIDAMCRGQITEISEKGNVFLTEDKYLEIIDGKTGALIKACCQAGAIAAGLPLPQQRALSSFATNFSRSYQIMDDLLDVRGDGGKTGKDKGTDLREQVVTLPYIELFKQDNIGSDAQRLFLQAPYNSWIPEILKDYFNTTNACEIVKEKARNYALQATDALGALPDCAPRRRLEYIAAKNLIRIN